MSHMKRFVASCFMLIRSVDSKKRNATHAGLGPSEEQTLFFITMEEGGRLFSWSAPLVLFCVPVK